MALLDNLNKAYNEAEYTSDFEEDQSFAYKYLVEIAFNQIHNRSNLNLKEHQKDVMYVINAIVDAVLNHKSHIVIYRKWQNISLIDELQKSLDVEFTKIFDNGYKIHGWT